MIDTSFDADLLGPEALPAGFAEIERTLRGYLESFSAETTDDRNARPVGLVAIVLEPSHRKD